MKENIYAFIDSQNLNLGIKSQGWKLDFKKFRVYLKDKYNVSKAYLFIGKLPGNENLYKYLEKAGYILVFKPVLDAKVGKKTIIKGNVDAELVLHSMIQLPYYNKAVIVSGDGDFYCLVEYLKQKNKLSKVLIPNKYKYSALLRQFINDLEYISDLKKKVNKKERH